MTIMPKGLIGGRSRHNNRGVAFTHSQILFQSRNNDNIDSNNNMHSSIHDYICKIKGKNNDKRNNLE